MLVWLILGLQFTSDSGPVDRTMFVSVAIVIAGLAILASRRTPVSRSQDNYGGGHGGDGGDGGH
jgi:hypothetical protein